MSWRNMFEVWHYDKPKVDKHQVKAEAPILRWHMAAEFPKYTEGFRVHNRGAFNIAYAYQKQPTTYEVLEAGVADFKTFCPKELWLANLEITPGRDVDVYIEFWTPDTKSHWPDFLMIHLGTFIERIRGFFKR